jgi:hypothetical protein
MMKMTTTPTIITRGIGGGTRRMKEEEEIGVGMQRENIMTIEEVVEMVGKVKAEVEVDHGEAVGEMTTGGMGVGLLLQRQRIRERGGARVERREDRVAVERKTDVMILIRLLLTEPGHHHHPLLLPPLLLLPPPLLYLKLLDKLLLLQFLLTCPT